MEPVPSNGLRKCAPGDSSPIVDGMKELKCAVIGPDATPFEFRLVGSCLIVDCCMGMCHLRMDPVSATSIYSACLEREDRLGKKQDQKARLLCILSGTWRRTFNPGDTREWNRSLAALANMRQALPPEVACSNRFPYPTLLQPDPLGRRDLVTLGAKLVMSEAGAASFVLRCGSQTWHMTAPLTLAEQIAWLVEAVASRDSQREDIQTMDEALYQISSFDAAAGEEAVAAEVSWIARMALADVRARELIHECSEACHQAA